MPAADVAAAPFDAIRGEIVVVNQELARLSAAVASGGDVQTLLKAIKERERHHDALAGLALLEQARRSTRFDLRRVERDLGARLDTGVGCSRGTSRRRGRFLASCFRRRSCSRR